MWSEITHRPSTVVLLILVVGYLVYQIFFKQTVRWPKQLPVLNARDGEWFPVLRASWRNTRDFKGALLLASTQYKDTAIIFPHLENDGTVILPASQSQFIVDQPESVLNVHESMVDALQADFTVSDPSIVRNPTHVHTIAKDLTSQTSNLLPGLSEENMAGFAEMWGQDSTGWREICVFESMKSIIGRVTNRAFIGLPLCRNLDLLEAGMAYARDLPLSSLLLGFLPPFLRPVLAPLITIPNKLHARTFFNLLVPEVERRLQQYERNQADPEAKSAEPNDLLQWTIRHAKVSSDPTEADPRKLAGRILFMNVVAIFTSSFTITNAIFDLLSSKQEYLDQVREEVMSVLAAYGGQWKKQGLAKMTKLDSVLRESSRINSFVPVGIQRKVVAKEGLTLPQGVVVPKGMHVAVPAYPIMHDSSNYPDPETFKPFRFVNRQQHPLDGDESAVNESVKKARLAFATTSNEYFTFGHGRHACPGRFFASNELKLMLGHAIHMYEFELLETRPPARWLGQTRMPPLQATIRIRRRPDV